MKRSFLVLAGLSLTAAAFASATLVHDNMGGQYDDAGKMKNTYQHSYAPGGITNGSTAERGYEVLLAAPGVLTGMMGSYVSYMNAAFSNPTGTETFRVRIYLEDSTVQPAVASGAPYAYVLAAPSTIKYDSGQIPVSLFGSQNFALALPNVSVPANFAYTCKPENFLQDTANAHSTWGQQLSGPPTTGPMTKHALWRRNDPTGAPNSWQLVALATYDGGPPVGPGAGGADIYGNMQGRFWTGCGPNAAYITANYWEDWDVNIAGANIYDVYTAETGDDVTCEGWRRTCNGVELAYLADVAFPTGTESVTVNLYAYVAGSNTSALYGSVPAAAPFATATLSGFDCTAGGHVLVVPFANVAVPNKFIYTVTWGGSLAQGTAGNQCGNFLADTPTIGGSCATTFWTFDLVSGTLLDNQWYGNPWFDNLTFGDGVAGAYNNPYCNLVAAIDTVAEPMIVKAETGAASTGSDYNGTTFAAAANDDANYWEIRPGVVFSGTFDPLCVDFMAHVPCNDMTTLTAKLNCRSTTGRIRLGYKLATYPGGTFSPAGTAATPCVNGANTVDGSDTAHSLPFGTGGVPPDATISVNVPVANIGDASTRYETKIRFQCKAMAVVFGYPWRLMVDEMHWEVTP